jgi:CBS domain-containing protein
VKEHEFWRERTGGHVYAVELVDGLISGTCGPLEAGDLDHMFLASFDYTPDQAAWLEEHRDEFDLHELLPRPMVPVTPRHPQLENRVVSEAMHPGVMTCNSGSSLYEVARTMTAHGVHAVAVWGDEEDDSEGFRGMISDLDLVSAAVRGESFASSALTAAKTEVLFVRASAKLSDGARLMVNHRTTHLIVLADDRDRAVGVLSALDVARALTVA